MSKKSLFSQKTVYKIRRLKARFNWKFFYQKDVKVSSLIEKIKAEKLSYLENYALYELSQAVLNQEKQQVEGVIVETGCALGGSSILIASIKEKSRAFYLYDVFEMIPPPTQEDGSDVQKRYETIASGKSQGINGDVYYGYEQNLYDQVVQSFYKFDVDVESNNVHLVPGLYQESLHVNSPVSLAHIDCDWYESVQTCLHRIEPNLVSGGTLIIDDYYTWSGCKKAVDEYFSKLPKANYKFIEKSRLHIVKK